MDSDARNKKKRQSALYTPVALACIRREICLGKDTLRPCFLQQAGQYLERFALPQDEPAAPVLQTRIQHTQSVKKKCLPNLPGIRWRKQSGIQDEQWDDRASLVERFVQRQVAAQAQIWTDPPNGCVHKRILQPTLLKTTFFGAPAARYESENGKPDSRFGNREKGFYLHFLQSFTII